MNDFTKHFLLTPKQSIEWASEAPQQLSVGGVRSGKTTGALMKGVLKYCLKHKRCDILVLRRSFPELESGCIKDLEVHCSVPDGTGSFIRGYRWQDQKHIATFSNGSRIVFGHCNNNKDRDIAQYLGQSYSFILVDECAQFSPEAWNLLASRNTVNPGCMPDEFGNMPKSKLWGCTNPIGPFWAFYKTLFVDQKPCPMPEGAFRNHDGRWGVKHGEEIKWEYDPKRYFFSHSTVYNNPFLIKRDPEIFARLDALPEQMRQKMLYGMMDSVDGQYYDCFSPSAHVLNLRESPDEIKWQKHSPVWIGWDWGIAHYNVIVFFTKALVRVPGLPDAPPAYREKTIVFKEIVLNGKKQQDRQTLSQQEIVQKLNESCTLPNGQSFKLEAAYFSHEKFARQMEENTPAEMLSNLLYAVGQPGVTPATRDRVASCTFLYNQFKTNDIVILDTCVELIAALPQLLRDQKRPEDVMKLDNKADDVFDAFRYGLFGKMGTYEKTQEELQEERTNRVVPLFARRVMQVKNTWDADKAEENLTRIPLGWQLREPKGY